MGESVCLFFLWCPDWPPCHTQIAMWPPVELLGEGRAVKSRCSLRHSNVSFTQVATYLPRRHAVIEITTSERRQVLIDCLGSATTKSSKFERRASLQPCQIQRERRGHQFEPLEVATWFDCDLSRCVSCMEAWLKPPIPSQASCCAIKPPEAHMCNAIVCQSHNAQSASWSHETNMGPGKVNCG